MSTPACYMKTDHPGILKTSRRMTRPMWRFRPDDRCAYVGTQPAPTRANKNKRNRAIRQIKERKGDWYQLCKQISLLHPWQVVHLTAGAVALHACSTVCSTPLMHAHSQPLQYTTIRPRQHSGPLCFQNLHCFYSAYPNRYSVEKLSK
jgi:hypothetical protein